FFDTVPWDLVVKAVEAVTDCPWVLLYVKRWLAAPLRLPDGTVVERKQGTPQGGLCSAAHNEPNEQCRVMRSAGLSGLVGVGSAVERCA
ncbi:MAG: RNA-directed polymerase, partial [Acidimicrobiaceae bacterium]|nr:RNA-directed polymerase [Acidimicrobiaceae bacterium]